VRGGEVNKEGLIKIRARIARFPYRTLLTTVLTVFRKTFGVLTLALAAIAIAVIAVNPLQWIAHLLPLKFYTVWGVSHISEPSLQALLTTLYTDQLVFGSAIGVASLLVLIAWVSWFSHPVRAVVDLGRGIKASPMAVVHSPVNAYRKIAQFRNWLLAKVEFLQGESAKWKTTFNILKSPYSLLRSMGLSPSMAATLLFGASAVGGGVVVNETILSERSFSRGDSGVYAASVLGADLPLDVPTEYVQGSNTLRIDLGSTPVREIIIENVSVGTVFTGSALPSGQQNVVQISGNVVSGGTNTRLEIGHLIFEKSRCKKLELTDIQAHTIIIRGNASDGQSIAPSPGTSRMRAIGGGHQQADAMVTSGGTYDRIWIQAPTSAVNGKVDTLRLTNLFTKGGICHLSRLTIGTLELLKNEVGEGNGFSTKEFTVSTTVTGANITIEDNVEVTIAEPATS
jgi:hypothetical protein